LYTDAEIRGIAEGIAELEEGKAASLDVVPNGRTLPRGEVFDRLGLDERRLPPCRVCGFMNCTILEWRLSPGYAVSCMTGWTEAKGELSLPLLHRRRPVYGIRIYRRELERLNEWWLP
jgi:hypothetical protein